MIEPLRDDCAERYSAIRQKWAKRWDDGRGLLRKTILRQLSLRPDIDYKDLWTDKEERQIAARCMGVCKEMLGLPNERLVPDDPLEILVAADGDGGDNFLDFIRALEYDFRLNLMCEDGVDKMTTLGDLVRYVNKHQGELTLAETCKRRRIGWGCSALLWLLFASLTACLYFDISGMVEAVRNNSVAWRKVLGLAIGLVLYGIAILVVCALVADWFKERKAIREERQKSEKDSSE